MPTAEIGRWEFNVPDGWELRDAGIDVSYIEAPDGSMGFYVKTINSNPGEPTAQGLAAYIQGAHRRGFEADPQAVWVVTEASVIQEGDLCWSKLELWDEPANYRVLSLVVSSAEHAVQFSFHDYACSDYQEPNAAFAEVERSLRLAAGAA